EEDDAGDEVVGVAHLLDRFLAPLLGEVAVAPIVQEPVMQPVLVDGGELVPERLVEIVDDGCVAAHGFLRWSRMPGAPARSARARTLTMPEVGSVGKGEAGG